MTTSNRPYPFIFRIFPFCVAASIISVFFFDQPLAQYFSESGLEEFWLLNREVTDLGLSTHYFLFSSVLFTLLYLWGHFAKSHPSWRKPLQNWSGIFFASLVTSGVTVILLKFLFGRLRPHQSAPEFNPTHFDAFSFHWHNQSFPSGHSQVVFCVATMGALLFPRMTFVFAVFALALSFTRVVTHNHFLSDCIMGAFIGWSVTLVTHYLVQNWLRRGRPHFLKNQE